MTAIAQAEKVGALTAEQAANARLALTSAGAVPTTELLPSMQGDRNSPENQQAFDRIVATTLASAANKEEINRKAFTSNRQATLREMYKTPEELTSAIMGGSLSKDDARAGIDLLTQGDAKENAYGNVKDNTTQLIKLATKSTVMTNYGTAVAGAILKDSNMKKTNPEIYAAAQDYPKVDANGEKLDGGPVINRADAIEKYGDKILDSSPSQAKNYSKETIDAFAASKNDNIRTKAGDFISRAVQSGGSEMGSKALESAENLRREAARTYAKQATDATWSAEADNVKRLAESESVKEYNPELSLQARIHRDNGSSHAVSSIDLSADRSFARLSSLDDKEKAGLSSGEVNAIRDIAIKRNIASRSGQIHTLGDRRITQGYIGSTSFYKLKPAQQAAWRSLDKVLNGQ